MGMVVSCALAKPFSLTWSLEIERDYLFYVLVCGSNATDDMIGYVYSIPKFLKTLGDWCFCTLRKEVTGF